MCVRASACMHTHAKTVIISEDHNYKSVVTLCFYIGICLY